MPDLTENNARDHPLINLHQAQEMRAWTRSLDCSEEALRAAVQAVGHVPKAVRSYLAHRSAAGSRAGAEASPLVQSDADKGRHANAGHYSQYGMRDDPRGVLTSHPENPGTGEGPRRFGAGGDEASYDDRGPRSARTQDASGAQRPQGPIAQVSSSGSAREPGHDHGGERLEGPQLSSRQGAELIGEKRRMDHDR